MGQGREGLDLHLKSDERRMLLPRTAVCIEGAKWQRSAFAEDKR